MPNLSSSIQKLAIRLIALVAVAIGVLVAASSLDGLSTNPLQAQVQLRAVSLSSESTLLPSKDEDLVAEDYVEEVTVSPDTVAADRRPKRFYVVTITAQDNPGEHVYVEIAKATPKSARVWIGPSRSEQHFFGDYSEVAAQPSLNGMTVGLRTDDTGKASLLLESGKYLVAFPKIKVWDADYYRETAIKQERKRAMFLTLFLALAFFGAAVALMSRDTAFLIFSAWLITSLRVLAMNSGWGYAWIEDWLPQQLIAPALTATLALHAFLTVSLFGRLYEGDQRFQRTSLVLRYLSYTCLALGAVAFLLPKNLVHPALLATCGVGMICLVLQVVRHANAKRDLSSFLYVVAWVTMLAGLAGEIISVSTMLALFPKVLNAETGTLACGAMLALALAQRLKEEATSRELAQVLASQADARSAKNYAAMPIGLFGVEADGTLRVFNPAFAELYQSIAGNTALLHSSRLDDILGKDASLLWDEKLSDSSPLAIQSLPRNEAVKHLEFRISSNSGGLEGSVQDISARVTAEAALARLIDHDVQTKALNQRGLNDAVERAIKAVRAGRPCALVELDVDRFKTLNDLYGHLVGDQLLASVCDRLLLTLRPGDEIARIGDSFRIVLFDCDSEISMACAGSLHQAISNRPIEVAGRVLTVTASVGLVPIDDSMDVRDAIAASSQACAEAKQKGRNRVVHMAKQDMALRGYLEELKVQENLQDKINSQRFFLEFQPIVSFRSAFETLNYEVLVRMRGENGAAISPGRFIPAAERNGQMSLIDRWVLLKTLHWINDHHEHLKRLDYATINLSGASLNDARFVDNIFSMISDFPAVMSKLCFEITETVALADRRATRRFSERVHSMGGRIALDDFGAGYTSFTYLREIEADLIKIDGSFVRDINQNPANHAITRMIVELSHELGKRCVAEWAERPDVIATLMQLGVDYGQGYALARPMEPESLLFAGSSGDLVTEPTVRALLRGTLSPEQVAADPSWTTKQTALF